MLSVFLDFDLVESLASDFLGTLDLVVSSLFSSSEKAESSSPSLLLLILTLMGSKLASLSASYQS